MPPATWGGRCSRSPARSGRPAPGPSKPARRPSRKPRKRPSRHTARPPKSVREPRFTRDTPATRNCRDSRLNGIGARRRTEPSPGCIPDPEAHQRLTLWRNVPMLKRSWLRSVLFLAVLLSMSPATHAARPDTWITMKAKSALYLAPDVHGTDVKVDTINGHVTLHGTVGNETEKTRAQEEVGKIEGVVDVRNLLQVANKAATQSKTPRADAAIKGDVERALKGDRSLDDS